MFDAMNVANAHREYKKSNIVMCIAASSKSYFVRIGMILTGATLFLFSIPHASLRSPDQLEAR